VAVSDVDNVMTQLLEVSHRDLRVCKAEVWPDIGERERSDGIYEPRCRGGERSARKRAMDVIGSEHSIPESGDKREPQEASLYGSWHASSCSGSMRDFATLPHGQG